MKKYKFIYLLVSVLLLSSCSLEEKPPFLSNSNVYGTPETAKAALTGIYSSLNAYDNYGYSFMFMTYMNSGFGVTKAGGTTGLQNSILTALKPSSNYNVSNGSWQAIYKSIAYTNDAISSAKVFDSPSTIGEKNINDVVGQAYFIRAFLYFNLVRIWGEVPLRIVPTDTETVHKPRSSVKKIYAQIIADIKKANQLMNGSVGNGTVKPQAANMLLAKVYMTLATAPSTIQTESALTYWQMAYVEAKKVYGVYSLVPKYDDLFTEAKGDNTVESIFELQSSIGASNDHLRSFTASNYTKSTTFGQLFVHANIYNQHVATYPGDARLATTYLSTYTQSTGVIAKNYPDNTTRSWIGVAHPYILKLGARDQSITSQSTNKNFKIYRYADLLLMLAEISNELQNGEQLGYVKEVLNRVGLTPQAGYSGGQASFRNAIMKEYQFELMAEGHEWFNNRRRGFQYFLDNVITPHNTSTNPKFNPVVDVMQSTVESEVMTWPIPLIEVSGNLLINQLDE